MPGEFKLKEESEFIQASVDCDIAKLSALFKADHSLINKPASNGSYPLMFAAEKGDLKAVNWFIANNVNIDALSEENPPNRNEDTLNTKVTALRLAVMNEKWDCTQALLEAGAKHLDLVDKNGLLEGITMLWFAAMANQWDIVKALLSAGARNIDATPEMDAEADQKKPTLILSILAGQESIVRTLLEKGASLVVRWQSSLNTLKFALPNAKSSLTDKYFNIGKILKAAQDLFIHARKNTGTVEELNYILNILGNSLNGCECGKTALKVAIEHNHGVLIDLLVSRGANYLTTQENETDIKNLLYHEGEINPSLVAEFGLTETPTIIAFSKLAFVKSLLEQPNKEKLEANTEKSSTVLLQPKEEAEKLMEQTLACLKKIDIASRACFEAALKLEEPLKSQVLIDLGTSLNNALPFTQSLIPFIKTVLVQIQPPSDEQDETSAENYKKACALYIQLSLGEASFDAAKSPSLDEEEFSVEMDEKSFQKERLRRILHAQNAIEANLLSPLILGYVLGPGYSVNPVNSILRQGSSKSQGKMHIDRLAEILEVIKQEFNRLKSELSASALASRSTYSVRTSDSCTRELHFQHSSNMSSSCSRLSSSFSTSTSSSDCSLTI